MTDRTQTATAHLPTLVGARVLITGTRAGLGRALVDAFAAAGAHVLAHARTDAQAAAVAREAAAATGGFVRSIGADLAAAEAAQRLVHAASDLLGGLDVLILNAGMLGEMGPLADTPTDLLRQVLEVNVVAQHALVRQALPPLRDSGDGVLICL